MDEKSIFNNARNIPDPVTREAYLKLACGDNTDSLKRIQELLAANAEDTNFLEKPPSELGVTQSFKDDTAWIGERVGRYKLLQEIGEGGMGSVYMAEQTEPVKRRVALKIIKAGMDSKQVIARFEAERQALAMMDHPNIARLLDVGTTDSGRPYFVMELVKGVPITEYCDDHRLSVKQRLGLFTSVCNAVQHAHQKGIIHRDLKPSNILVAEYDDEVVPKIIDFGLAKALHQSLTDRTMFTQLGQVVGTLAYMSPEQSKMNQLDVDTRTDIYSLGVLLYALLTGETPFDQKRLQSAAIDECLRIIQHEEPPRPSTRLSSSDNLKAIASQRQCEPYRLNTMIRGDLDWIVIKALEKDRARRYQTANGLAADILRYMDGEPTVAAPPDVNYRIRKFVKRHRVAVFVSLSLLLIMVLGIFGTSAGLRWALIEKGKAIQSASQANRSARDAEDAKIRAIRNEKQAIAASHASEYSKYNANLQALDSANNRQARTMAIALMQNSPPKFRNWEWAYQAFRVWHHSVDDENRNPIANLSSGQPETTREFWQQRYVRVTQDLVSPEVSAGMYNGRFSKDGSNVYLSRYDGGIDIFSTSTGERIKDLPNAHGGLLDIGVSPDGSQLAGFVFSGGVFIWDVADGRIVRHHPFDLDLFSTWCCVWSQDGKQIVSAHMGGNLRVWDSKTLEQMEWSPLRGHRADVGTMHVPTNGNQVWSASLDGSICKWSMDDGKLIEAKHCPVKIDVQYQCVDDQGKHAIAVGRGGESIVWDIDAERVVARLQTPQNPHRVGDVGHHASFSPDGTCVVVVSGQKVAKIFDVSNGNEIAQISGQGADLVAVRFGPDGRQLLAVGEDSKARLWTCSNAPNSQLATAHKDVIYQVDMDDDGKRLLTGSYDRTATIWDMETWKRQVTYRGHDVQILAADIHPDGDRAATLDANGSLHLWDASTGQLIRRIDPGSNEFATYIQRAGGGLRANILHFPAVLSTGLFTPDGSRFVAFRGDSMKVFDSESGEELIALNGAKRSGWPVYSFDSKLVGVLEMNARSIKIWDLDTGQHLHTLAGHRKGLIMAQFSPVDNRLVTAAIDLSIRIWDAESGKIVHELQDNSSHASCCRFSADGKLIIAGYTDCLIRLWDATSGKLLKRFAGHNNRLRDVRFNPDGTRLLSWSVNDEALLWDATGLNDSPLVIFDGESRLVQACWTPDGRDILSFWSVGSIEIWQGATRKDLEPFRKDQKVQRQDIDELRSQINRKRMDGQ